LLGIVAFFLPWLQISCGPIKIGFSGYELATGAWQEKLSTEHEEAFKHRWDEALAPSPKRSTTARLPRAQPRSEPTTPAAPSASDPKLWVVPVACAILFLLGIISVPRAPTLLVSAAAAAYLAFFGVTTEQQFGDVQYTGGILGHEWLLGYWASWIGLVAPATVALLKPRKPEAQSIAR
jgi:hypothetical protein